MDSSFTSCGLLLRRVIVVALCAAFFVAPTLAQTPETVDFSQFDPGDTIGEFGICDGDITVSVLGVDLEPGVPASEDFPALDVGCEGANAAIVFDSDCTGAGCTGGDPDLGVGLGNLLIVHEHCSELDGFVEDPDDESGENEVYFSFSDPVTFCQYTAVDNEFDDEIDNGFFYSDPAFTNLIASSNTPFTGDAGVVDVGAGTLAPFAEENASGAINGDGCVEGVESIRFFRRGSRGLTNLDLVCPPDEPPPPCDGECFQTDLLESVDNGDGTHTYTFETCKISSFCRGFSFVAIEIPDGAEVLSASRPYSVNSNGAFDPGGKNSKDLDGTPIPDFDFIKFEDIGGNGNVGQCESITFTVDAAYTGDVRVVVKFGRTDDDNKQKTELLLANLGECTNGDGQRSAAARAAGTAPELTAVSVYPNPLRTTATFTVSLDEATPVRLVVYDVRGREVAVVTEGRLSAGPTTVNYDASGLSTGVYIYRLETPEGITTGRFSVLK
ncbi:MAG: T9SS type A sorting domain-containing protein [Rhodothermales bacterium]|nr:T9SS type A sorting domain-containing protein [Rhodothermales bacterium]